MSQVHIKSNVNGDDIEFLCEPEETLLEVLRDRLHLTGSKKKGSIYTNVILTFGNKNLGENYNKKVV